MCGRYATSRSAADLVDEFDIRDVEGELEPDYNVAPTKDVWAVMERPTRGEPAEPPHRQLRVVRWGLVPSWAKDPSIGSRLINARTETIAAKPAFKKAFAKRRCLLPADGYYEWYDPPDGPRTTKGARRKQPFFIRPRGGGVLAMAGLYELWRDETRDRDDLDAWLWTATVLTTTAEDELGHIHDRMPMLLERDQYDAWLDPARSDPDELLPLLVPAAPGRLEAYPVSTDVGNLANGGAYLAEPLEPADQPLGVTAPDGAVHPVVFDQPRVPVRPGRGPEPGATAQAVEGEQLHLIDQPDDALRRR